MKLTVAAIRYDIDQNQPSDPFLLTVECPDSPTREDVLNAIYEGARHLFTYEDQEDGKICDLNKVVDWRDSSARPFGDLEIGDDPCLIVGLPNDLAESLGCSAGRYGLPDFRVEQFPS